MFVNHFFKKKSGNSLVCLLFLTLIIFSPNIMAIEEPDFDVLQAEASFELREYKKFIIAETELNGSFDSASRKGFRRVASYIFGGNKGLDGSSEKIQMTAPVTVTPDKSNWKLHFVMPKNYSLSDLPIPNDKNVKIRAVPAHQAAVVIFSGWTTEAKLNKKASELELWIKKQGLKVMGPVQVARYNDPFTLPWLRRNEIIVQVKQPRAN